MDNPAAVALMLMVVGDQITAGTELESARHTSAHLVTAQTSDKVPGLPANIADQAGSGLIVAAVPNHEPSLALEESREQCEALGAELVVIERNDNQPMIYWATEQSDGQSV